MAEVKISELTTGSALDGTELIEMVQGGASLKTTTQDIADLYQLENSGVTAGSYTNANITVDEKGRVIAASNGNSAYKVYSALLTQSSTSAPSATELQNNTSGTIVWTRSGAGQYIGTITGDTFTANKTFVLINQPVGIRLLSSNRNSNTQILLACKDFGGSFQDDFSNLSLEIRIYN